MIKEVKVTKTVERRFCDYCKKPFDYNELNRVYSGIVNLETSAADYECHQECVDLIIANGMKHE